jgi:hypothetical protein
MYFFAICTHCGRYAAASPATPGESTQALHDWASEHSPGVQMFADKPEGWPRGVSGVHTNGHLKVTLRRGLRREATCSSCAVAWPCPAYVEQAASCPANGLGLVPDAPPALDT